ncbi:hypothetical protein FQN49_008239 [Arthroderma sp. PD_2]|nr:hypothetical protein FQN49_008239 [Arthroderma sp. PD_2]
MPIRLPDTSISSIPLDPLSPASSDLVIGSSDSESDRDDAARAAKRRRIERVARDYLQGHPPFILTATLNGPFDDGWANPWRKVRNQRQTAPQLVTATAIPTPRPPSIQSEKPVKPIPPGLQQKPSLILGTDSYQSSNLSSGTRHRRISANLGSQSSSRQSSKSRSASTSGAWLKKDKAPIRRPLNEPPRSPSPSPSVRLNNHNPHASKRQLERSQRSSSSSHRAATPSRQVTHHRTLSFTAVNAPAPVCTTPPLPTHETETNGLDRGLDRESSAVSDEPTKRSSQRTCLVHLSKNPGPGNPEARDTIPTTGPLLRESDQKEVDEPASTGNTPGGAANNSSLQHAAPPEEEEPDPPNGNETITSTNETRKTTLTCNTFVPPLSQREREAQKTGSTLPERDSETMPAAQIVPAIFTPPQLTPFTSADLLQLPFNQSNDSVKNGGPSNGEACETTEARASAPETQGLLANNPCPPPIKGARQNPPARLRRVVSNNASQRVIKPFHSFSNNGGPRASETGSRSTVPSKSTRFQDANEAIVDQAEEQPASTDARSSNRPQNGSTPNLQATHGPTKSATRASCPAILLPQKDDRTSQPASRVGEHSSTVHSSGTPMSLTMAMSGLTDLSTQPDGQGLLVLQENFDLTGAIEDAESFLQSWDIERDRQRLRDSSKAANGC